jgi:hypothetical protein
VINRAVRQCPLEGMWVVQIHDCLVTIPDRAERVKQIVVQALGSVGVTPRTVVGLRAGICPIDCRIGGHDLGRVIPFYIASFGLAVALLDIDQLQPLLIQFGSLLDEFLLQALKDRASHFGRCLIRTEHLVKFILRDR